MPFIPVSSFQWKRQSDNRRCWPNVWGWRLSRQQRGCLYSFRNSFHSPLSQTLDDINITCLVISRDFRASAVPDCTSQECGLPVWLWALAARYLPSPLSHPNPSLALSPFTHQELPWAGENSGLRPLLWPWVAGQHPCLGAS